MSHRVTAYAEGREIASLELGSSGLRALQQASVDPYFLYGAQSHNLGWSGSGEVVRLEPVLAEDAYFYVLQTSAEAARKCAAYLLEKVLEFTRTVYEARGRTLEIAFH